MDTLKLIAMINLMEEATRASLRKGVQINLKEGIIFATRESMDNAIRMGIRATREMLQGHLQTPDKFDGFFLVQDQKKIIGRITRDGAFEENLAPPLKTRMVDLVAESVLTRADEVISLSGKRAQRSAHHVIHFTNVVKWAEERIELGI